ncbi:MAG TPA: TlpA disulfide reductase family protein [Rhizomicrobium sp.]|nr:TlpA disulfide reductase family protein [Rhizomicrobium sp.]
MTEYLKRPLVLAALAVVLVAVAAVLYVNRSTVNADRPPSVLSALVPAAKAETVPAVAFTDAAGKPHMLSEFRGKYVLLNMWATWCGPCVKELPSLAKLKGEVPDGFTVVAVNVGRSTEAETRGFLAAHSASALAAYTDRNLAMMRSLHVYGLPVSLLIDPKGNVVARADGPAPWDAPEAVDYFKALSRARS